MSGLIDFDAFGSTADGDSALNAYVLDARADILAENRRLTALFDADEKRQHSDRNRNITGHYSDGKQDLKRFEGRQQAAVKGQLKLTAYVHNRVTISAYQGGRKVVGRRLSAVDLAGLARQSCNFNLCRETRHGLKIGGRWRNLPVTTDFTSRARNWIRDGGYIIETESKGVGLFLTLTIPGGTKEVYDTVSIASGYMVDRFNRWLRYRCSDSWFAYVWELQERGAPHLHYMFRLPHNTDFPAFYKETRAEWRKICMDVSGQSNVDLFMSATGQSHKTNVNLPSINFKVIKTKISGYLAKYASKKRSKAGHDSGWNPGRWWGISYPLRQEVLKRRVTVVLGLETLDASADLARKICAETVQLYEKLWRKDSEIEMPGEFFSIQVPAGTSKMLVESIVLWLLFGDATALANMQQHARAAPRHKKEVRNDTTE